MYLNIKSQISNIEMKMGNPIEMGIPMNMPMMMPMNMNMNMMNQGMEIPLFDNINNNNNNNIKGSEIEKYNIVFESNKGGRYNLIVDKGTTVNEMLEQYFEELINE